MFFIRYRKDYKAYKSNIYSFVKRHVFDVTGNEKRNQIYQKPNVTDSEYYNQMKKFEIESEGAPKGSLKFLRLRNKAYVELKEVQKESVFNKVVESPSHTDYLRFYIVVSADDFWSYKLVNVLNYNKVLYQLVSIYYLCIKLARRFE